MTQRLHPLYSHILLPLISMNLSTSLLVLSELRSRGTLAIALGQFLNHSRQYSQEIHVTVLALQPHPLFDLLPLLQLLFQTLFLRLLTALHSLSQTLKQTPLKSSLKGVVPRLFGEELIVHVISVSRFKQLSFLRYRYLK